MKTALRPHKNIVLALTGLMGLIALTLLALYIVYPTALTALGISVGQNSFVAPDYYPTQGWRTSTPEEQGFDSVKLAEGLRAIREKNIAIHSLTLIRNGSVFLDAYFYPYDGSIYHDLASETKSVMTTLIGIAASQGKLNLDAPMVSFFPNRTIANRDARKERITVRHLASNSSGLDCTEEGNERTLQEMWASPDWVLFVLDRPMTYEPGTHWTYCSPGMHLLSAILQQATGMTAHAYAREYLFKPLGILESDWPMDPQGYSHGWGDLALHPRDMDKIGYLWYAQGNWDGRQIVPSEWVNASTKTYFTGTGRAEDYGYGWWVSPASEQMKYYMAVGRAGQRMQVLPGLRAIVSMTGGGYEYDQVSPYILAAMRDLNKPLPPNPDGVAQLKQALAAIQRGPAPSSVRALPEIARAVSGKTFVFPSNAATLKSMRLEFDGSAAATFHAVESNEESPRIVSVGLDGLFRSSRGGRPILARGQWEDAATFFLEINEGPGLGGYSVRARFAGDQVTLELPGQDSLVGRMTEK